MKHFSDFFNLIKTDSFWRGCCNFTRPTLLVTLTACW